MGVRPKMSHSSSSIRKKRNPTRWPGSNSTSTSTSLSGVKSSRTPGQQQQPDAVAPAELGDPFLWHVALHAHLASPLDISYHSLAP